MNARESSSSWPADKVERWPLGSLIPYAQNVRTHSEEQVLQIAASIRQWGWTVPILVDDAGVVIAGHGRVLAAQRLELSEVPVMVAAGWSDKQKRAYSIADNKLALNAGWNEDLLRIELADLKALGADLALTGFGELELKALFAGSIKGRVDPDEIPEPPANPISARGDVWLLGRHRITCGDSTNGDDVQRALDGAKPNLMVTDPPYGVKYNPKWRADVGVNRSRTKMGKVLNDDRADWREAWAHFPGDVAYVWHAGRFTGVVGSSLVSCGFALRSQIIWGKDRFALSRGDYHWQHEPCWYAVREGKTGHWKGDRKQSTLWNIAAREDAGFGHSTQKPVECMRRPIENNSEPGQLVYEPFCGSGTTIIAAEMTGRTCHALELDSLYVDIAVLRWQSFAASAALLEQTNETFDQVRDRRLRDAGAVALVAE
jgi:DNA modification methylase